VHPDLNRFVQLWDAEQALQAAEGARKAWLKRLADADASVVTAKKAAVDAELALKTLKGKEQGIQGELDQLGARKRSATRVLETGAGDATAAERQLAQVAAMTDTLETELLELMDQIEGAQKAVAAARTQVPVVEKAAAEKKSAEEPHGPRYDKAIADAQSARDQRWADVPTDLQRKWTMVLEKKKPPIARIINQTCEFCNFHIPAQLANDIRFKDTFAKCDGCYRWLVPDVK
jgi:predicted  nucleic acid-binding Zn-ribbon protein